MAKKKKTEKLHKFKQKVSDLELEIKKLQGRLEDNVELENVLADQSKAIEYLQAAIASSNEVSKANTQSNETIKKLQMQLQDNDSFETTLAKQSETIESLQARVTQFIETQTGPESKEQQTLLQDNDLLENTTLQEPTQPNNANSMEFLLQDANRIGQRIQWYLEQHEKLETLAIMVSGGVWAFVFTNSGKGMLYLAWLPTSVTALFWLKSTLFTATIREAFEYIYQIESDFNLPENKGWVHYFRAKSSKYKRIWRRVFWSITLFANILVATIFTAVLVIQSQKPDPEIKPLLNQQNQIQSVEPSKQIDIPEK